MYTLGSILQTACQNTRAWQVETAFNIANGDGIGDLRGIIEKLELGGVSFLVAQNHK